MRKELIKNILKALKACDGLPMPESALIGAVQNLSRMKSPTVADVKDALAEAERSDYVAGASDDISETTWTLTVKGIHKVRQI